MKIFKRLAVLPAVLTCLLGAAAAPADAPKEGVQYLRLAKPAGVDPRQVAELFSYNCPHSYEIEKPLADWAARQRPPVQVLHIPAVWPNQHDMVAHARLYYTLDQLGLAQQKTLAVFHAVRDLHQDLTTENHVLAWAAGEGLDTASVRKAYESREVSDLVRQAPALRERYQVGEQPTVIVGGRFHTNLSLTRSVATTISVVDYLYRQSSH
ncbi:thiol:disulfide interchange protein DsbA/DsbL [Streptomyces melanogenes]|uniref:thiol:disulfide interchange protein DsbA/DsbL n=1 Tax=Streptomyces melanogenes TaxID=67326 RepID=UPI00167E575D|nr:thiol:disulfide interchange protein DsbA/DsbL [Streptomyces melanogenes]GGP86314.1 thiol:disulfide interchange protein [Streptomyces melanogenes]